MNTLQPRKSEAGFTLVELAIVMVIIGLLIGGILKGQELIGNAKITSQIAQVNAIEGSMSGFRDKYGTVPGDMLNGAGRIPNCPLATCGANGNANGRIDSVLVTAAQANNENMNAFRQMAAANFLTGVDPVGGLAYGAGLPEGKIGGGIRIGFSAAGVVDGFDDGAAGHYLILNNTAPGTAITAALAQTGGVVGADQAANIDRKMDDGRPNSGSVRASTNGAGAKGCVSEAGAAGLYNEAIGTLCGLTFRIQG
ncbi:MAG: prepilin-type N-terminal cleavage/methylation domain-containing protein [Alphaproteobacteria bacterium]|nr:prepilin-type N-terminal cleavage/methylation domain-containing protein [Alphaproteobacteria bacterium]NCQ87774.1 prepilin-type N-terminal cleavage/methylation domain-containing protein [Alphaproteobacteria bacterium]NCT05718.1 prepilin-type N-terminal cleavage/methylation domain-containing protein [Alphaproteobacteria bacterium]